MNTPSKSDSLRWQTPCVNCGCMVPREAVVWLPADPERARLPYCPKCAEKMMPPQDKFWSWGGTEPPRSGVGMSRTDFDHLIESDLNVYLRGLRDEKETEYANQVDTLLNFHRAGPFAGLTPAQYCVILAIKHMQGITNQVMRGEWVWAYRLPDGGEGLKQRIADAINYLCLLFALLAEEAGDAATQGD